MLKAENLRQFFENELEIDEFIFEIKVALENDEIFHYQFVNMDDVFYVSRQNFINLCEWVFKDVLPIDYLEIIARTIHESEHFELGDDDVIAEVCYNWAFPEDVLDKNQLKTHLKWLTGEVELPD